MRSPLKNIFFIRRRLLDTKEPHTEDLDSVAGSVDQLTLKNPLSRASKVVLYYYVFAFLWIGLSDRVLDSFVENPDILTQFQTVKGLFFVAITGIILFFVLKRNFNQLSVSDKLLGEYFQIARERAAEAERANQSKSLFLTNMSHEIRTPIGAIQGFIELLLDSGSLRGEQREWLTIALRNTRQLTRLVDDILDITRVETDQLKIEKEYFLLHDLIDEVSKTMKMNAEKKGLGFRLILPENLPRVVISDPMRMKQILENLIGNSIKFTKEGSVDVTVSLTPSPEMPGTSVFVVQVTDTGIGLTEDEQNKIFQPFYQADSSLSRKFGGTGLGLYLSRKLAQALGGDVHLVRSEPNKETVFGMSILLELVDSVGNKNADSLVSELEARDKRVEPQRQLENRKILVVEDSVDNQNLFQRILTRAGASVDVADNGAVGVEKALAGDFDLILMDIQMPEVDGYEALKRLKIQHYTHPVLALTAHAMKEERDRAISFGFDGYLTKPVSRSDLIGSVSAALKKREKPELGLV